MQSFVTTLLHRPYVFAFLISFLTIGILNRGLGRTILFLVSGFSIAWLSEYSSIRNGFPYGMYHYLYENLKGEILLGGVPVWDSLSYSFLAYASYEMAYWYRPSPLSPFTFSLLPAFLMVLLDVVVDPLAVRGDQWFLGKIFYYPNGGIYFGVPISNFCGWFLVALSIFYSYNFLERHLFRSAPPLQKPFLGPLFYGGILAFNLLITFWIGEIVLGVVGLTLHLMTFTILFLLSRRN